ncbi:MAG: hypothetical protein B7Z38_07345, partial [Rhodobacterales bacterium 12-64-8]
TEIDDDHTPGTLIEDVAQDFLDANGRAISDDEAYNDPLANQVTDNLTARGYTSVETLIGPTQVRATGYRATGDTIEVIYDRATGAVLRETTGLGLANDDDYLPGTLIEDVAHDFLDDEGNVIVPEEEDDLDLIEIEDEVEVDDDLAIEVDDEDETDDDQPREDDGSEDHDTEAGGDEGGEAEGEGEGGEGEGGED